MNYQAICKRFLEIRTVFDMSQAEFTKELYILPNNYGQVELGKRKPTITLILAIIDEYNINPTWLLTGEESMFKKKEEKHSEVININRDVIIQSHIPPALQEFLFKHKIDIDGLELPPPNLLVPYAARAGYYDNQFFDEPEQIQLVHLPFIDIHTEHRTFEVEGDSMIPSFSPGDFVVCARIEKPDFVKDRLVYVFVSDGSYIIKRVKNDLKRHHYILRSDNIEYEPYIRSWSEVREVWLVKYRITKNTGIIPNYKND